MEERNIKEDQIDFDQLVRELESNDITFQKNKGKPI